tara:strand:- start:1332 stop:2459 length:1128 start_codon:yes stop_codon:yes gene_type:complete
MSIPKSFDKKAAYELIDELLELVSPDAHIIDRRHMRQLMLTAALVAHDQPDRLNLKIMNRSLRELRRGFNTFAPWSDVQKIAVFGSARSPQGSVHFEMAAECAKGLVDAGFMVVTGAGPGVMEAANKGAGTENSFGVNIMLPFEQQANPYIEGDPKLVNFKYFFTRKVVFVKETDGVILLPGGFGTQDEGFETLTLVQTGKSDPRPIVMLEDKDSTYWDEWDRYCRSALLDRGLISPDDLNLYTIVNDPREAIQHVSHFYRNFHSIRYIDGELVIRMQHRPSARLIEQLNDEFKGIITRGSITEAEPHAFEAEEPGVLGLHRLRLAFDQKHLGRLRLLIDRLNDAVTDQQVETGPHFRPVHGVTPEAGLAEEDDD